MGATVKLCLRSKVSSGAVMNTIKGIKAKAFLKHWLEPNDSVYPAGCCVHEMRDTLN